MMHSLASPSPPLQISLARQTPSQWQYHGAMSIGGRHRGALHLVANDVERLRSESCRRWKSKGQRRPGRLHRGPGGGREGKRGCCAVRTWLIAHQSQYRRGREVDRVLNIGTIRVGCSVQLADRTGGKGRNFCGGGWYCRAAKAPASCEWLDMFFWWMK